MPFENGVNWQPLEPGKRGRHASFASAVDAVYREMSVERNAFFEGLVGNWKTLFPDLAARPGRWEHGNIYLYVRSAPGLYAMRPRLPAIRRRLAALPGAPSRFEVRLEIHA